MPEPIGADLLTAISTQVGTLAAGNMLASASIVCALAEAGTVDQMKVVAWAKFFAENQPGQMDPMMRESVSAQLMQFADLIKAMATKPAGAGRG